MQGIPTLCPVPASLAGARAQPCTGHSAQDHRVVPNFALLPPWPCKRPQQLGRIGAERFSSAPVPASGHSPPSPFGEFARTLQPLGGAAPGAALACWQSRAPRSARLAARPLLWGAASSLSCRHPSPTAPPAPTVRLAGRACPPSLNKPLTTGQQPPVRMDVYWTIFAVAAVVAAALEWRNRQGKGGAGSGAADRGFLAFKNNYLLVYSLMMGEPACLPSFRAPFRAWVGSGVCRPAADPGAGLKFQTAPPDGDGFKPPPHVWLAHPCRRPPAALPPPPASDCLQPETGCRGRTCTACTTFTGSTWAPSASCSSRVRLLSFLTPQNAMPCGAWLPLTLGSGGLVPPRPTKPSPHNSPLTCRFRLLDGLRHRGRRPGRQAVSVQWLRSAVLGIACTPCCSDLVALRCPLSMLNAPATPPTSLPPRALQRPQARGADLLRHLRRRLRHQALQQLLGALRRPRALRHRHEPALLRLRVLAGQRALQARLRGRLAGRHLFERRLPGQRADGHPGGWVPVAAVHAVLCCPCCLLLAARCSLREICSPSQPSSPNPPFPSLSLLNNRPGCKRPGRDARPGPRGAL